MATFTGGPGNDTLFGGAGDDTLLGAAGSDALNGGSGNDRLDGGPERDFLAGGPGKDVFFFNSPSEGDDTIVDFRGGDDVLALSRSGFGLSPNTQPGLG